jgi:hypothetical protein
MKHLAIVVAASLVLAVAGAGVAPAAFAAPAYEMIWYIITGGPSFLRIQVATGQVVTARGSQLVLTVDPAPLPAGDYHLYLEQVDARSWYLNRMDSQSGRTWFLSCPASGPCYWTEYKGP